MEVWRDGGLIHLIVNSLKVTTTVVLPMKLTQAVVATTNDSCSNLNLIHIIQISNYSWSKIKSNGMHARSLR